MSGGGEAPLFPKRGGPEYVRWLAKWDTSVLGKGLGPIHRMATDPAKKLVSLDGGPGEFTADEEAPRRSRRNSPSSTMA